MQVKAQRLREAMMLLERTVPRKPKSKIVANVFLKDGKVTATDLDIDVSLDLPEVDIECLLPHREVYEMLKYVDGNDMVTVTPDGGTVNLVWESGKATYYPGKLEDYPVHEGFELAVKGSVNGDKVIKAMMSLVDYCEVAEGKNGGRPILQGVAVILGEKLELWGADGFRLANVHLDESYPATETIIIPADTVRTLSPARTWSGASPRMAGRPTSCSTQRATPSTTASGASRNGYARKPGSPCSMPTMRTVNSKKAGASHSSSGPTIT